MTVLAESALSMRGRADIVADGFGGETLEQAIAAQYVLGSSGSASDRPRGRSRTSTSTLSTTRKSD